MTEKPILPDPPVCLQPLPVKFIVVDRLYALEPADARALLANIEGLKSCLMEYQLWGKEVEQLWTK